MTPSKPIPDSSPTDATVTPAPATSAPAGSPGEPVQSTRRIMRGEDTSADAERDLAEVSAVELVSTVAVHLLSAAALRCGLAEDGEELQDLDEARTIITALAGLVTAAAPDLGDTHARALRDGLRSVQLAFREASVVPDAPGEGPGEKYTGPVS